MNKALFRLMAGLFFGMLLTQALSYLAMPVGISACIVPIRQGLEWCSGKYPDYYNYVSLAEFLKEEPYNTSEKAIDLRPWLIKPVTVLKEERIGQRKRSYQNDSLPR